VQINPAEHHHRQAQVRQWPVHQPPQLIAGAVNEHARHRRLRRRPGIVLELLTDRLLSAPIPASGNAGQHPLQHHVAELVAIGEMLIALKRQLRLAIGRPDPRPADLDTPATERHLPILMAMTNRDTVRIVLAPRTDDPLDLGLEQLPQHTQPNLDRQRQQPLSCRPNQRPERLPHPLLEHALIVDRLSDR